jgi:Zn-dependent metalloprotease
VLGGDVVVHGSKNGAFRGVELAFAGTMRPNMQANVSEAVAANIAQQSFRGTGRVTSQELVVFVHEGASHLAYEVVVSGALPSGDPSALHVLVDAQSGQVRGQWDGIETVTGRGNGFYYGNVSLETTTKDGKFVLQDPTRGNSRTWDMNNQQFDSPWAPIALLSDEDNKWGNGKLTDRVSVGVDAQFGTAMAWDYFKVTHGRRGVLNSGTGNDSRVHYGIKLTNAFWDGYCSCATYGDGDGKTYGSFAALDVVGHELSHGITMATAGLNYFGESGGLNEATSDIFGTMVEYFAQSAKDAPDYLIGEMVHLPNPTGPKAFRFMYQPSLDGHSPDCYSSKVKDLENVHHSSGVANHFFYLLAEGSAPAGGPKSPTCNGSSIRGIGRTKAARIWYRALTTYMTSTTDYSGGRKATILAARDLYGAGSPETKTVEAAWSAVSVR